MKHHLIIVQIVRGLIRDTRSRRSAMFFLLLAALVQLFLGATFLDGYLAARPWFFLGYWAICGWLTLAAALLALYDMLLLRVSENVLRKDLRRHIFGRGEPGSESEEDPSPKDPADRDSS